MGSVMTRAQVALRETRGGRLRSHALASCILRSYSEIIHVAPRGRVIPQVPCHRRLVSHCVSGAVEIEVQVAPALMYTFLGSFLLSALAFLHELPVTELYCAT